MDLKNVSDSEVNELIEGLKFPKKIMGLQEARQRVAELFQIRFDSEIIDEDNDILYILHVKRGRIQDRYSIHLRFKETHEHLLRVDINPPRHENPDGTVLERGEHHIHIYSNLNKRRDAIAYPISLEEFPNVSTLIETFEAFLRKAKIKERTN